MLYLLALIGAVAIFAALWAVLGSGLNPFPPTRRRAVAPDDDPEFLRRISRPRPPEG